MARSFVRFVGDRCQGGRVGVATLSDVLECSDVKGSADLHEDASLADGDGCRLRLMAKMRMVGRECDDVDVCFKGEEVRAKIEESKRLEAV